MTHHVLRNMGRGGRGRGAAFTLLELLVVTSVVGLLAAVLLYLAVLDCLKVELFRRLGLQ